MKATGKIYLGVEFEPTVEKLKAITGQTNHPKAIRKVIHQIVSQAALQGVESLPIEAIEINMAKARKLGAKVKAEKKEAA